jgi:hypothetical protein
MTEISASAIAAFNLPVPDTGVIMASHTTVFGTETLPSVLMLNHHPGPGGDLAPLSKWVRTETGAGCSAQTEEPALCQTGLSLNQRYYAKTKVSSINLKLAEGIQQ